MYLPMFAFSAAAALWLARVKAPAVLAGVALLLAALSVQRTMVWMTEESLWREAVERAPKKLRPKIQLARALPAAKGLEVLAKARLDRLTNRRSLPKPARSCLAKASPMARWKSSDAPWR